MRASSRQRLRGRISIVTRWNCAPHAKQYGSSRNPSASEQGASTEQPCTGPRGDPFFEEAQTPTTSPARPYDQRRAPFHPRQIGGSNRVSFRTREGGQRSLLMCPFLTQELQRVPD